MTTAVFLILAGVALLLVWIALAPVQLQRLVAANARWWIALPVNLLLLMTVTAGLLLEHIGHELAGLASLIEGEREAQDRMARPGPDEGRPS